MINAIITSAVCVTAIGLICAVILVLAAKFMSVPENETEKKIRECLPGANCGACGYTGCDGYAKALAEDPDIKTNLCIPGAAATADAIASVLGKEAEAAVAKVAVVRCMGNCEKTEKKADYAGIDTCAAAKMLFGGDGKCTFGCLGRGDCQKVCPQGAVCIDGGIARIDPRKCIGCGICQKTCPNGIISIMPDTDRQAVMCSNKEKGAAARKECTNACIGCGKCQKTCPEGAVTVKDNLASIDYDKCTGCGACREACPVGCILPLKGSKKVG